MGTVLLIQEKSSLGEKCPILVEEKGFYSGLLFAVREDLASAKGLPLVEQSLWIQPSTANQDSDTEPKFKLQKLFGKESTAGLP